MWQPRSLDDRPPRHSHDGPAAAAHVFALVVFAVAEPLFDLLSRQTGFLLAHDAQPLDLVLIALLPSVALPVALLLLTHVPAWWSRHAARWVHLLVVAGLSGLIALQLLKRLAPEAPGGLLIAAAAAMAAASAAGYRRWSAVRTFLTYVSPAAALSPALFLFASPARDLLLPERPEAGPAEHRLAGQPVRQHAETPVVMVILDELPMSSLLDESNAIDPLRYPNLAALAGDAYWFRDASTVSGGTHFSVPIILSGRLPEGKVTPLLKHYPDNLFTWLAGAGYRLHAVEAGTRLCPPELRSREVTRRPGLVERFDAIATDLTVVYLHLLLPADLATRLPAINATWRDFTPTIGARLKQLRGAAPETADAKQRPAAPKQYPGLPSRFSVFLRSLGRSDQPALHFVHLELPHVPWQYLPSGRRYGPVPTLPHGVVSETWGADEWEVTQGYQRHLLQVGYVDRLIGLMVTELELLDLYDSALIVLVADHGVSFRPRAPRRSMTAKHFADILNIPFIVKLPAQEQGVISDRNVETIDILPTVADALDLAISWPVDGQSAIDSSLPERQQKFSVSPLDRHRLGRRRWNIEDMRADRRRTVAHKLRLFGSGARPGGLFRIGRRADLLGRRVVEVGVAAAGEPATEIRLDRAWQYREVDPNSRFVPAHVTGRARFAHRRDAPAELAVAVNGTIEAVTHTFGHADRQARFTAMVREEVFLAGHNRVEILEISTRTAGLISTRQRSDAEFTLVGRPGDEAIRSASGLRIPLVEGSLRGKAKLRKNSAGIRLRGWAIGPEKQAAETLLVFIDRRLFAVVGTGLAPDSRRGKTMEPWRREASFRVPLPSDLRASPQKIRLIAILGEVAGEIPLQAPRVGPATTAPPRSTSPSADPR